MSSATINLCNGYFSQLGRLESESCAKPIKQLSAAVHHPLQFKGSCIADSRSFLPRNPQMLCRLASRKEAEDHFMSNTTEDTDEMFDDLFAKYGKVVFRSNKMKPSTEEADDDAESLSFAVAMAKVASEVKAADIKVLFVKPLVYWTRFFIIATAFSRPQIDAIGSKIRNLAEGKYGKIATGDTKPNSWTLLDFGDVVVHIFLPEQRALYNLEEFYANATPIELPFENQPPLRSYGHALPVMVFEIGPGHVGLELRGPELLRYEAFGLADLAMQ